MASASKGNGNYLPFLHPLHVHVHDPGPIALQSLPSIPADLWFLFHSHTRCTATHLKVPMHCGKSTSLACSNCTISKVIFAVLHCLNLNVLSFVCPAQLKCWVLSKVSGLALPPSWSHYLGYWQYLFAEFHGTVLLWKPHSLWTQACADHSAQHREVLTTTTTTLFLSRGQGGAHPWNQEPVVEGLPHSQVKTAAWSRHRGRWAHRSSWVRSLTACPLPPSASSGHYRHVPGAGRQHIPAGVPGCGQGQGQGRDDDLLPQWRASPQLADASSRCQQPGLQRNGTASFAP